MKKLLLAILAILLLSPNIFAQDGSSDFEREYVKKNLIKKVKTTYEYYETEGKGKPKKKDRREGKVVYSFDDNGRIIIAEFFYQDGSPSKKDEYTYNPAGVIQTVKKSQVLGSYNQSRTEKVYYYEFHYTDRGDLEYADLTMYDVYNGKKGGESQKKLEELSIYYPACFEPANDDKYKRDNQGLIKSIATDEDHVQTFDYEFF